MDTHHLIRDLENALSSLSANTGQLDDQQRHQVLQSCRTLCAAVETPVNRFVTWLDLQTEISLYIVLRMGIDIGLFSLFQEAPPGAELDISDIASQTGINEEFIGRLMRYLVSFRVFDITPQGKCKATSFAKSFCPNQSAFAGVVWMSSISGRSLFNLPEYLKQRDYQCPRDGSCGPFQHEFRTHLTLYDWLQAHPLEGESFNLLMETSSSKTEAGVWTQYLPESWISDHLLSRKNRDGKPFTIVDVGGGYGQELTAFRDAFPNLEGRYILQDRSAVPPSHTKNSKTTHNTKDGAEQAQIEVMRHDFFNPQPVFGADVYLLSRILHNWPDEKARVILSHLCAAMSQDSTLLVIDRIFPDKLERVSETMTMLDLGMMASLSALERTEGQCRELLSSVGLRLINVCRAVNSHGDDECRAILQVVKG